VTSKSYSGGDVITVDYTALTNLQSRMAGIYQDIEQNLTTLAEQIERLRTTWEGAAAEGFQQSVQAWQNAAADLHQRLADLHNMVGTAHDNQARTVRSNSRIWAGRRA
jgi:6 kDa early secretory antigenic target